MRAYEGLFIFSAETAAQDNITAEITGWIQRFEGAVEQVTEHGSRKLGFRITKKTEGKVFSAQFQMNPAQVDALKKMLDLEPKLLSFMVTFPPSKKPVPKFFKADDFAGAGYGDRDYGRN